MKILANDGIDASAKISLTPHIGAATEEAQKRIGEELAEKLIDAFLKAESLA